MATTKANNVRQKLAQARLAFLNKNVKKSGKNMHLEFMYFELQDIVPAAIEIFAEVGLVTTTNFDGTTATMTVYNTDNVEEDGITFTAPYREVEPIISNKGAQVTNAMQALGSSITYLRRYLYMMVLDIVEHDTIDGELGSDTETPPTDPVPPKPAKSAKKTPATAAERKAAKEKLTSTPDPASESQIGELKSYCKTLLEKDEKHEDFVQEIALKTEGFTKITSKACAALNKNLAEMIAQYK